MATSSKIYMDLSSISIDSPLRVILLHIKSNLNKMIDTSYSAMSIKDLEIGAVPLIRNAARVRKYRWLFVTRIKWKTFKSISPNRQNHLPKRNPSGHKQFLLPFSKRSPNKICLETTAICKGRRGWGGCLKYWI